MRLQILLVGILLCTCVFVNAQPVVGEGGILNVASYTRPGAEHYGIAQGSMFAVFGQNMGPPDLQWSGLPRPTELAGTSIRVTVGETSVDAFLVFTSAGHVSLPMSAEVRINEPMDAQPVGLALP